jgi:hypothetical protein
MFTRMRNFSKQYYPIYRFSTLYVDIVNFLKPEDIEVSTYWRMFFVASKVNF